MIRIRSWHGTIGTYSLNKLNEMAKVVSPEYEWDFEGTIGEFAEKWGGKFIAYPTTEDGYTWFIGVTDYPSFNAR